MAFDEATFNTNSTAITDALATIATAYAANKAALAAAVRATYDPSRSSPSTVSGALASRWPLEVAKAMVTAGLRDVLEAARDNGVADQNDLTFPGGTTDLHDAWAARITAGQLGALS